MKEELAKAKEPDLADLLIRYHDMRNAGAWSNKAKVGNLQRFVNAFHFLKENQIFTVEELENQLHSLSAESDAILARMRENSDRLKQLDNMIALAQHIKRIHPIIDEMNAIHWKGRREKYKAAHQDEIDLYNNSKRVMKDNFGVTSLSVSTWQEEQKTLRRQNEELSTEYRPIREKVDKMLNVQHCVETARNANRSRQSNRQKNHQLLE